jgi:hypothetical protein
MRKRVVVGVLAVLATVGAATPIAPAAADTQPTHEGRYAVGVRTETFVDTSRPTDANGTYPDAPTRTLVITGHVPFGPPYGDIVITSVLHFLDRYLKHRGGSLHALLEDGNVPGVAQLDQAR